VVTKSCRPVPDGNRYYSAARLSRGKHRENGVQLGLHLLRSQIIGRYGAVKKNQIGGWNAGMSWLQNLVVSADLAAGAEIWHNLERQKIATGKGCMIGEVAERLKATVC
jgi:hypothetical protein